MARDIFRATMTLPDSSGTIKALEGIQITVVKRDTEETVRIYQRHTGVSEGPATDIGATSGPNPFETGASGMVEFWAEPGEYEVIVTDTHAPARISTRRIGWNSNPAGAKGTPTAWLAEDAGIVLASMAAKVIEQAIPIGGVIPWWRPTSIVPVPSGFVICDGSSLSGSQHEFPGVTGSINVPDMRNKFILGASIGQSDGAGMAVVADGASNAPGIRGAGGSQTITLTAAQLPQHTHPVVDTQPYRSGAYPLPGASGGSLYEGTQTQLVNTQTQNGTTGQAHSNVPAFVGLLFIMKVRRS